MLKRGIAEKCLCMDKLLSKIENVKIVIFIKYAIYAACEMLQPLNSLFKEELIQFELRFWNLTDCSKYSFYIHKEQMI